MKKLLTTLLLLCSTIMCLGLTLRVEAASIEKAPVRNEEGYLGRTYNAQFDKMFDNFERATLESVEGTGLWWANTEETNADLTERDGYLHVAYQDTFGMSKDNPIYKAASGANSEGVYPYLVFVMRGSGSIDDFVLSFRYDDNHNDIDVDFADLVDPDLTALPELTNEYKVYIIDILNSLDGLQYVKEGETPIDAGSEMVGFHLLAKPNTSGIVDIKEVYYSKAVNTLGYVDTTENSLIDLFQRENVHEPVGIYWCGSAGKIIGKHLMMEANSSYKAAGYDVSNVTGTYENIVIRVRGEQGNENLGISPFYVKESGEEWGEEVDFAELKGPDGLAIPAITKEFQTIVINFNNSNIDPLINGLKILNKAGTIYIDQIFFTNMEYDASELVTDFPVLDSQDILLWDNFERETLGATPAYDGNNQVAIENGFSFIIAYAGIDRMSIIDGNLVMDCTNSSDYLHYTAAASARINDGSYPYVVFKVKTTDEGDLSQFRIKSIAKDDVHSNDIWANGGLKSGTGFNVATELQEGYRYITADGYTYLVIDLAASNLSTMPEGFDIYYSGTGKLWIDSIFFAKASVDVPDMTKEIDFDNFNRDVIDQNENHWWYDTNATIVDSAAKFDFSTASAHYRSAGKQGFQNADTGYRYLAITMKGEELTTLDSFRFSLISPDSQTIFVNSDKVILADGAILETTALTTEYQTFIIDLVASGISNPSCEGLELRFGDWSNGICYIDGIKFIGAVDVTSLIEEKVASLTTIPPIEVLDNPVISLNNSTITINTVEGAEQYEIYVNDEIKATITELTYDLATLELTEGTYQIKVKAISTTMEASDFSNSVSYVVTSPDPTPSQSGCSNCSNASVILILSALIATASMFVLLKKKH